MSKQRISLIWFSLWLGTVGFACGVSKQIQTAQDQKKASQIRSRSTDAFAELDAAERGEPAPRPKSVEKDPIQSMESQPEKPYAPKAVDSVKINPARSMPRWVVSQPDMPGYYVGIGVSMSHGNEADDWARARNHAYVELASTLKVQIQSVILDYFKENNLRMYQGDELVRDTSRQDASYAMDTSFFVEQTLEGVEIHDRWKDHQQNKYWMLVRLSKADLERRLQARLELAKKKAVDYFRAGLGARAEGRIADGLRGWFRAYLALQEYFGGVIEADLDGGNPPRVLNHEIERSIQTLLSGLKWEPEAGDRQAMVGNELQEPLRVAVRYKNRPVGSLPVRFDFVRGTGSVEQQVVTSEDGWAAGRVLKVFGDKKAILGARIDVERLVEGEYEAGIINAKFGTLLDSSIGKFVINLKALSAFVYIRQIDLGRETSSDGIASDIKELLYKELGVVFESSKHGADMQITGRAETGDCTDFYQKRMCNARVQVDVVDNQTGRQLFSKRYKIAGTGTDDAEASRDALQKAGPKIAKKIIQLLK